MFRRQLVLLALGSALPLTTHGQLFSSTFSDSSAPGWIFDSTAGNFSPGLTAGMGIDPVGDGWLRLTTADIFQATSARFDQDLAAVNNRISVTFDYTAWGGTGADGLTWFLYDASVEQSNGGSGFSTGGEGGSLGYANRTGVDGLTGAFLGVGVDRFGNFSNPTEGRNGGVGFRANQVALRGPGDGQDGYEFIAGTNDGVNPSLGVPLDFGARPETNTPTEGNFYRFKMQLTEDNVVEVFANLDPLNSTSYNLLFSADMTSFMSEPRPEALRFGLAASTGARTNYHEVRNLSIFVSEALDNAFFWTGSSNNNWGVGNTRFNWIGDRVPPNSADVFFENDVVSAARTTVNITNQAGGTRTVSSLNFDHTTGYTLNNNTVEFDTGSSRLPSLNVTDFNGISAVTHTINSALVSNQDLTINNSAILAELVINGSLQLNGNDLSLEGQGTTTINGNITNGGDLIRNGLGTTNFTGSSDFATVTIESGTINLNRTGGPALGNANEIQINGGTLLLSQDNQIADTANLTLSGGQLVLGAGVNQTLDTLTLSANSQLSFADGSSTLTFESEVYSGGTLTITGWDGDFISGGGSTQIVFSDRPSDDFINNIFWADSGIQGSVLIERTDGSWEVVPIPEPATVIAGVLLTGFAVLHFIAVFRRSGNQKLNSEN